MKIPYFTLTRKLIESDLWLSEKFTKAQAWVDLIGLANWRDETAKMGGVPFSVKRGEVARSKVFLSKRWRWSRGKVIRFLDGMEMDKQIVQQTVHLKKDVTSLICLVNYDQYQIGGTPNGTADGTPNGTPKEEYKERKEITRGKSALDLFAPEINGWDKNEVEKTIDGLISMRKSNKISYGVLEKEIEYWGKFSDVVVDQAIKSYNKNRYWEKSKGEKYLRGIMRGKNTSIQKESSQSIFQKGF